jgi:hypothetical protein
MEGRGKAHWAPDATTIWLAGEREDTRADLRPFGWLLLERANDLLTDDHLRRWCDAELNALRSQSAPRGSPTRTSPTDLRPSGATAAAEPRARQSQAQREIVWERAQLQFNPHNGTLTATGPGNARANAFDERAQELLSRLPAEVQGALQANRRVQVVARVRDYDLIDVEVKT